MQEMKRLWAYTFSAMIIVTCLEVRAEENKDIIVFNFTGKGGAAARDRIVKVLLGEGYNIVSRKKASKIALGMGHKTLPASTQIRLEIARTMNVGAFLSGKVKVKGKNRFLTIKILVTCEGGIVHTLDYDWVGKNAPADTVTLAAIQIDKEIQAGIETCCWTEPEPVPGPVSVKPGKKKKKKKKISLVKGEGGKYCKLEGSRCWLPPAVIADLGFLISSRNFKVPATDGRKYVYEGAAYPLFGMDVYLNIARLFLKNPMYSVGILFNFAHSLLLTSHPLEDESMDIGTKDVRLKAGLNLEIAPKPDSLPLWVFFDLGWGMHNFLVELDPLSNPFISDLNYKFVDIGFGFRADIVKRWLDVQIRMGFMAPYTLGDAEKFYGSSAKKRFGFNAGIRISGVIAYGARWNLGFDYIGYVADFKGEGTISPTYASGDKMKDFYPTGYIMFGYRL